MSLLKVAAGLVDLAVRVALKKRSPPIQFQINSYILFLDKKTPALGLVLFIPS
jgi:hypothetical protein